MGKLTKNWEWKKLGEVCDIYNGSTPSKKNSAYWENGQIPWFTIDDIRQQGKTINYPNQKITDLALKETSVKLLPKDTVLLCCTASVGAYALTKIPLTTNQQFNGLVIKKDYANKVVPEFLMWACSRLAKELDKFAGATSFKFVSVKSLSNIEISVPPLPIQQKIVSILERAESLKQKREQANEEANKIIQSIFYKMFGDPIKNEKGWEKKPLKEIANIQRDSVVPEDIKNMKYVGLEHIESTTGNILEVVEVNKGDLKSNKFLFDDECVLFGKLRPYLNKIALPNFKGICSTDILPIKPIKNKANRFFVAYLLKNPYYVRKATEQSTGANLPRLSPKQLESFEVYTPPISLQNQFASLVKKIESIKQTQSEATAEISTLFDALMQKAFKGELA